MNEDIATKVKEVNRMLKEQEPNNVSVDSYSGYTGYKPMYLIDNMNCVFGFGGWGFAEVASEIVSTPTEKAPSMLAVAQVRVWLRGCDAEFTAWGQSRVTKGDIGDARKGAATDALKKGLSYFSIGNRAFHGLLSKGKQ